jgi:hypothetical protein
LKLASRLPIATLFKKKFDILLLPLTASEPVNVWICVSKPPKWFEPLTINPDEVTNKALSDTIEPT